MSAIGTGRPRRARTGSESAGRVPGAGAIIGDAPVAVVGGVRDGQDVADHLRTLTRERARAVGEAALRRVLAEHTYAHRGAEVDALLKREMAARLEEVAA